MSTTKENSVSTDKTLAPSERRFVAKQMGLAKSSLWGVYDRQRGSWPGISMEVGLVAQNHRTWEEAQKEADRIEGRWR